MTTQKILFEPEVTLPVSDKVLFDVCNNAEKFWIHKQPFFIFKSKILEKFATKSGIAKQFIDVKCNTCGGSGRYSNWGKNEDCKSCMHGLYQRREYYLQEYVMNGSVYYVPVAYMGGMPSVSKYIKGHIIHEPIEGIPPNLAYAALLYKYDKPKLGEFIFWFGGRLGPTDWKRWGEISQGKANFIEALAAWYGVHLQTTDDLPF